MSELESVRRVNPMDYRITVILTAPGGWSIELDRSVIEQMNLNLRWERRFDVMVQLADITLTAIVPELPATRDSSPVAGQKDGE